MNDRFGEELTLDEILSDEEKAEDKFLKSRSGDNFGPELTLEQALEILYETSLPPRATFWVTNDPKVQEAISNHRTTLEIGEYRFKIEYLARITSVRKFDTSTPMAYIKFYPNGKAPDDPESVDRDSGTTGSPGETDV